MKKCKWCKKELTEFDKGNFLCANCKKNLIETGKKAGTVLATIALAVVAVSGKNKDE